MTHSKGVLSAIFALFLATACSAGVDERVGTTGQTVGATAGTYLVDFKGQVPAGFAAQVAALGGHVAFLEKSGFALVRNLDADAAEALRADHAINDIQPDVTFTLDAKASSAVASAGITPQSPTDPTTAFLYGAQWNMRAIGADQAWAAGRLGSAGVTVAVIDSGIDYLHPDLLGRVDLSRSVSFMPDDDALAEEYFPDRNPVTDLMLHGTLVSSVIASNAYVLAGVTSGTTLMAVKACNVYGYCSDGAIIAGMYYAINNGADVVNLSLGGGFAKTGMGRYVGLTNKVFNAARAAGVTIVAAAGNDALDMDHDGNLAHICTLPAVICVSATAPAATGGVYGPFEDVDTPTYYTNYGRSAINVAAPGGTDTAGDGGWLYGDCSTSSLVIPQCQSSYLVLGAAGTSGSAPHVSGLAALLVEQYGRNPARIRAAIDKYATDLGQPGVDPYFGHGRIDVPATLGL